MFFLRQIIQSSNNRLEENYRLVFTIDTTQPAIFFSTYPSCLRQRPNGTVLLFVKMINECLFMPVFYYRSHFFFRQGNHRSRIAFRTMYLDTYLALLILAVDLMVVVNWLPRFSIGFWLERKRKNKFGRFLLLILMGYPVRLHRLRHQRNDVSSNLKGLRNTPNSG